MLVEISESKQVIVKTLRASMKVRYWEDSLVNNIEDKDGDLIPLRSGSLWEIDIDLNTGIINNWPNGKTADIHYKVCDAGSYTLLSDDGLEVASYDGYVPTMLSPEGEGYGDYVIMKINESGKIQGFCADLDNFMDLV